MSVPSKTIQCDKCGHSTGTPVLSGQHVYVVNDQEIQFFPKIGWCHACEALVPHEDLEITSQELEAISTNCDGMNEWLERRKKGFWGVIRRLWLGHLAFDLGDARKQLALLGHKWRRQGTEKCLKCGSTEILRMDLDAPLPIDHYFFKGQRGTGNHHPGCGGEFVVKGSDIRYLLTPIKRRYDEHGFFIDEMILGK